MKKIADVRHNRGSFVDRVDLRSLPGGGRLAVLPNPHAPTVTVVGMLQAGPAVATDGRFSVPGLTASMLNRGVLGQNRLQLARELEDHGLQLDVGSSSAAPASISFSLQGLAEELPRLIRLLAAVLRRPTFPADELEKVRQQILGVLRHENEDTSMRAYAELTRQMYVPGHPHRRRSIAEREEEVRRLTREDLEIFHHEVYGAATLVCVIVGQVEADDVFSLVAEAFDDWGPGRQALPPWPTPLVSEIQGTRIHIPDRPNLDVFLGHPGRLLLGDSDYPAAMLANSCLGQSTLTSRLGVAVRDKAGLTYGINSGFTGRLQLPGP
ncbi:MAG: insulinase family protein [Thermoanaerobaculales bacterium]|nr:insulinase family protein [Thermoanaerobaculales bacterium]